MKRQLNVDQANIHAIRTGAAVISQLLAEGDLHDDELDRAAQMLICCRKARKALEQVSTSDAPTSKTTGQAPAEVLPRPNEH